jgi:hypothetical protein
MLELCCANLAPAKTSQVDRNLTAARGILAEVVCKLGRCYVMENDYRFSS